MTSYCDQNARLINLRAQLIDGATRSNDCMVNLILIKHYNLESEIQGLLSTQGIVLACLVLSRSTTKF